MARIGMISLGCPKNLVDTESMLGAIAKAEYEIVVDETKADVLIINTCGFLKSAQQEALDEVRYAAKLKKKGECKRIIVTGCLPQRYPDLLRERDEVDAVLGIDPAERIVDTIERVLDGERVIAVSRPPHRWIENPDRLISTMPWKAYVKVSDGCINRCSYCAIPDIRGIHRSRPEEMIVEEARSMADLGVKEINLVGQDLTQYGLDFGSVDALPRLLEKLNSISALRWIRLMYCYPTKVSDQLIAAIADLEKVVKYIDVPFQHADSTILKAMNRKGDASDYLKLIDKLRSAIPDIAIRSTFIVGFPGEDEQAFERLMTFLNDARLDMAGAFAYSREPGTPAAELHGQVPKKVKESRLNRFMEAQSVYSRERNAGMIGKKMDVVIEGLRKHRLVGRSYRSAPRVDGFVYIDKKDAGLGEFINVEIKEAGDYDLFA